MVALGFGLRLDEGGIQADRHRASRPVHRPDETPRLDLLRRRLRGSRLVRAPGFDRAPRCARGGREGRGGRVSPGRDVRLRGGAAVLHEGRVVALPLVGRRCDRHDERHRGEALPGGGNRLCLHGVRHGL
jgi:hypothetical protein